MFRKYLNSVVGCDTKINGGDCKDVYDAKPLNDNANAKRFCRSLVSCYL